MLKQGMSVEEVTKIFDEFISEFNGNIDVLPLIKQKQEEIYGEQNSIEKSGIPIQGAYHPANRFVSLIASNLDNEKDTKTTIRHELLGHYGLNTFTTFEKMGMLVKVLETENEKTLKPIWDKVNRFYSEKGELERAEEVFAFVAEEKRSFLSSAWDGVRSTFQKVLRNSGLSKRPFTLSELRIEAKAVAEGIRNGSRKQQVFPKSDVEQFRKGEKMQKGKKPFHEVVADNLIKKLKEGTAPWQKPWKKGQEILPYNPTTNNRYKGINVLHLMAQGKEDPRWLTYNQAKELGGQVKLGEKSTSIQYWKFTEERNKKDESGNVILDENTKKPEKEIVTLERPKVFFSNVFNGSQIDGLPELKKLEPVEWNNHERAEKVLKASGAKIQHSEIDRAFYRPNTDSIHLPKKELFDTQDKYYATALHELGHWSGHESRLDRDLKHPFGSEGYAKEELVAEISSMILGHELQIGHDETQHVAYVESWIKVLKEDPLEIFRAAASAEKVKNYIMSFENNLTQDEIISKLEEAHSNSIEGYSSLESYINHKNLAELNGYESVIYESKEKKELCDFEIKYTNGSEELPLTTFLYLGDGKTVTHFHDERVNNCFFSSDNETQSDILEVGFNLVKQEIEENQKLLSPKITKHDSGLFSIITHDEKSELLSSLNEEKANKELGTIIKMSLALNSVESGKLHYEEWNELAESEEIPLFDNINSFTGKVVIKEDDDAFLVTAKQHDALSVVYSKHESETEAAHFGSRLEAIKKQADIFKGAVMKNPIQKEADHKIAADKVKEDKPNRIYLDVSFKEKEEVKNLGGKWDREERKWYVRSTMKLEPFSKWIPVDTNEKTKDNKKALKSDDRVYLAVPFKEKDSAKKSGAKWDAVASSWYADNQADMAKLKKYLPENNVAQQLPAKTPEQEFSDALKGVGAVVDGEHPIMDGKKHRIECEGDKRGEKSGFYVGHLDGRPAGFIMNNRTGIQQNWKSKGTILSDEEKSNLNAQAAEKKAIRKKETERVHEEVSKSLTSFFNVCAPVVDNVGYLATKGVDGVGLRVVPDKNVVLPTEIKDLIKIGNNYSESKQLREQNPSANVFTKGEILLPAYDLNDKLWSLQAIQSNGSKRFATNGKKEGNFHVIGGMKQLEEAPVIIIGEGYATVKDISDTSKLATVAAFDSGNLSNVAKIMRNRFPDKPILIAGDDDVKSALTSKQKVNVGRVKAKEAAASVNGTAFFPVFAPHEAENGLSDFNDLKLKSKLGKTGLERQVSNVIDKVVKNIKIDHSLPKVRQNNNYRSLSR